MGNVFDDGNNSPQIVDRLGGTPQNLDYQPGPGVRISNDGNLVLVPTSGNVYVYNRATGEARLAELNRAGDDTEPTGVFGGVFVSDGFLAGNGNYVAFRFNTNFYVPDVADGFFRANIYLKDFGAGPTGTTILASKSFDGSTPDAGGGGQAIADDGDVVFTSAGGNLVPNDTNNKADVFVYDIETDSVTRLVAVTTGQIVPGSIDISGDGRYVAFVSDEPGLATGQPVGHFSIFLHDRQTGETRFLSSYGQSIPRRVVLSQNGRYVAFDNGIVIPSDPNDPDAIRQVFVQDTQTGERIRVSQSRDGIGGNFASDLGSISADGRFVNFSTRSINLTADENASLGLFLVRNTLLP